jgi:hypothetical protein
VVETAFVNHYGPLGNLQIAQVDGSIRYAFVVSNPCPQVAVHTDYVVSAVDSSGREVRTVDGSTPIGVHDGVPDLQPGRKVGLSGEVGNGSGSGPAREHYDPTTVAAVKVTLKNTGWQPPASRTPGPAASAENVTAGARDRDGNLPITFTLRTAGDPGNKSMSILVRDSTGKLVTGEQRRFDKVGPASGDTVHTQIWVPAGLTAPRIEVFFVPG